MDDETTNLQQAVGINPSISVMKTADVVNSDGSDDTDDVIDSAGDTILYTVAVKNTGDSPLSGVVLIDPLIESTLDKNADGIVDGLDIVSGDDNQNGLLDIGETWVWTGAYEVSQKDIDARGNYDSPVDSDAINDNLIRNTVFVSTDQGATEDAEVDTTLDYDPQIRVTKTANVLNADGSDDTDNIIDTAGDIIDYTVRVKNIGNVTLSDFRLTDALAATTFDRNGDGVTDLLDVVSGDNGNGLLDVGEEWVLQGRYEVTQAVIDSRGNYDGQDGDTLNDNIVRNTVEVTTKTFDQNVSGIGDANTEVDYRPVILIQKEGTLYNPDGSLDEDGAVDSAGEVISYTLRVSNAGNVTLSNVVVVDPLVAASMDKNADGVIDVKDSDGGDDNANGLLDVGEVWFFSGIYEVSQSVIDARGTYDGPDPDTLNDKVIRNFAGATSLSTDGQQVTRDTFADTRVGFTPSLSVEKIFLNVTGGNDNLLADANGDLLNYRVLVTNTGNVTLTDVSVVDPLTGQSLSGLTLAPGETQEFLTSYTLSQDDLDGQGGGDGDIDNTVTANSAQTGPESSSVEVPLVYSPDLTIVKAADVKTVDEIGDVINYTISVSNIGNITLSGLTVTDPLIQASLAPRDLDLDGVIDGDLDADGLMDVGETWHWIGQYQVSSDDYAAAMASRDPYFISNTATADSNETGPKTDTEEVLMATAPPPLFEGLSPGYWKNHPEDWDGAAVSMSFEEFFFGTTQPGLNWKVMAINGAGKEKFSTQPDITLMQALELTGGDAAALARQAVAAVLNARDEDVTYQFNEAQIKGWVADALSGQPVDLDGDGTPEFAAGAMAIEGVKSLLDVNNNLGLV
jgi:large repetitive protein